MSFAQLISFRGDGLFQQYMRVEIKLGLVWVRINFLLFPMCDCTMFIRSHESLTLLTSTFSFHLQHLLAFPRLVFALRPPAVASILLFLFFSTGNTIISKSFTFITDFLFCQWVRRSCLLALLEIVQYFKVICAEEKKSWKTNTWFVQLWTNKIQGLCKHKKKKNGNSFSHT